MERPSAQAQDFAQIMKDVHQQVKDKLQMSVEKYKEQADKRTGDLHFKVGDLVMIHLKKERLPKGRYTKLFMKKAGFQNTQEMWK